jgi:hypothetical protein
LGLQAKRAGGDQTDNKEGFVDFHGEESKVVMPRIAGDQHRRETRLTLRCKIAPGLDQLHRVGIAFGGGLR